MAVQASELLRDGLLRGAGVAVASAPPGSAAAAAVIEAARDLGATVVAVDLGAGADAQEREAAVQETLAAAARTLDGLDSLVVDGAGPFGEGGAEGLVACMAAAWDAARAAAHAGMLERGGRIVLLAPAPGRAHAGAAVAGLENLARTLSIEWARFSVTTVALAPGATSAPGELAALVCWLLSPAGAYFSGCLMDLRGPRGGAPPA